MNVTPTSPRVAEPPARDPQPPASAEREAEAARPHGDIRRLLWLYLILLLVEGALRKWFLPQLSNPLLIIRDPVVLLIYLLALGRGIFPQNRLTVTLFGLAALTVLLSPFATKWNWMVMAFGFRTNFLHAPLIFLMPRVLDLRDVQKMGSFLFASTIPMALIVLLQFRSPSGAWINAAAGGSEGQLTVGLGRIRPPGTFSFTSGLACYLGLVIPFLLAWQVKKWKGRDALVYAALLSTGIMIGLSGSRTIIGIGVMSLAGTAFVCFINPGFFGKGVRAAVVLTLGFVVLRLWGEFQTGMMIHSDRLGDAANIRQGMIMRWFGSFLEPFSALEGTPIFGRGFGLGTAAAGSLMTGERTFLLAEGEWSRIVMESGPLLGFAFILWRVSLVFALFSDALSALREQENPYPFLIFFGITSVILNGQWGMATILGFACFGGGLVLAAAQLPPESTHATPFRLSPGSVTNPNHRVRGRSIYAEKLHRQ